ncbi:PAS domain-containing sensor histidine kinase [Pedobacter mucosus]|uniref:PAS domain-containing sensor histidine kinase n=1 Tax=Pedobacter mucosus TaxID=2895286 RepID=UPI001EE47489|nr:PAS domain S-box protein [Pedobacter mucosus]UKT62138.1 PAS domain-containing protein [Pedobacter mucosus]
MYENGKLTSTYLQYLQDGGEMGVLTRSFNWSDTALGHPRTWSQSLLTTLSIVLKSRFPMFLWWGTELIQFYNDAYRPSMGKHGKHPKALGQMGSECWPEIWSEIKPMIDKVFSSGESTWDEDRLMPIYRNGQIEDVYWTFSYSQVKDETGEIGGVLVICHETTEKVMALQKEITNTKVAKANNENLYSNNEELIKAQSLLAKAYYHVRAQEEKFRSIIEQAPVAIAIFRGPKFVIEVFNNKVLEFWDRTAEQVQNKPLFEALPEASDQGFEYLLSTVLTSGKTHIANELPVKLIRNGIIENTWINFVYEPIRDIAGLITGVMVICNEVTEQVNARKKIEENEMKFRQVTNMVIQMIWITDGDGINEYYNQRWYDFTGTDLKQLKGIGWNQLLHPDDQERELKTWNHSIKTGALYEIEFRLRSKSGKYIWVLGRAAPFYNSDGIIAKWFGTCTDINDQRMLMQQKDDFISVASHELKTPITALTASIQLLSRLKDNPLSDRFPVLIEQASKSLNKVNLLIKDLLNVTQFNNGQIHLNKTHVNLFNLIEDCCADIRLEGIYFIKTEGNLALTVYADALRIDQVIVNFIINAIKYAPESKKILITIENVNHTAKVSVTDKGQGIAADDLPHLFDRYFRVDETGSKYSGLGLGLYISGEIIRKHKGQIGATSELGKGSTFWFTLPID